MSPYAQVRIVLVMAKQTLTRTGSRVGAIDRAIDRADRDFC